MGEKSPRKDSDGAGRRSALIESVVGNLGAFLITYAVAFVLASVLVWAAGRLLSTGASLGMGVIALVALGLTLAFYWYERNNP